MYIVMILLSLEYFYFPIIKHSMITINKSKLKKHISNYETIVTRMKHF